MANLTDADTLSATAADLVDIQLEDSTEVQAGSLIVLDTAAGKSNRPDAGPGLMFLGLSAANLEADSSGNDVTDFTGGGAATGVREAITEIKKDIHKVLIGSAVAGLTAVTQIGEPVYATTDNPDDLTLTRPATDALVIGFVIGFTSSAVGDVWTLDPEIAWALNMVGGVKRQYITPQVDMVTAGGTTLVLPMTGSGRIVAMRSVASTPVTTASSTMDVQVAAGGVNAFTTPDDNLALADVDVANEVTEFPAFDNEPTFSDGDDVTFTFTDGSTVMLDGSIAFILDIEGLPGN